MPYTAEDVTITYGYRDSDLSEGNAMVRLPGSTTLADAETFGVTNLLPLLNALGSSPYAVNITMRRNRDLAPAGGAGEGEKKGVFLFVNDAKGQPTTKVAIPGIADVMEGDNRNINQVNADVQKFLFAVISGKQSDGTTDIVTGITGCVSRRGNALISASATLTKAKRAYKYHVASGKNARRRSS